MLSKMAHFVPLKRIPCSQELVQIFLTHVIRLHGVPSVIISDRGPQFISKFWQGVCSLLQMDHRLSTVYHPQTDGQTDRTNQTLEQYLRCLLTSLSTTRVETIPLAEFAYNNATHTSNGVSPFFFNYAQHPVFLPIPFPTELDNIPALKEHHQPLKAV